ncbi:MAG: hypothetical protein EAZ91_06215 [Cytophagales bacterium]|nr:MAG: hypothetical protein EAZ91_06215 [Cytophagales bacterium]
MARFVLKLMMLAGGLIGFKALLWVGIHTYCPNQTFRYEAAYKRDSLLWPIRQQVNTVFFGSSRTACSLVPAQFDSLTNHRTNSFNYGLSGLFVPDTFEEAERILTMDGLALRTIFFELSFPPEVNLIDRFDMERPFDALLFALDHELSQSSDLLKRLTNVLDSFVSSFLILRQPFRIALQSTNKAVRENYVMTSRGYRYFRNISRTDRFQAAAQSEEVRPATKADIEPSAYSRRIERLIRLCEQKNIALYFVIPNYLSGVEKRILPGMYATIPARLRFEMPPEHNSLTQMGVRYSDDGMHLNPRGASLFTARFAARYKQLVQP